VKSKTIKVLGLDLSTVTGYAMAEYTAGAPTPISTGEFGTISHKKINSWPRVNAIAADVMDVVARNQPDLVVIEGYGFGQMASIVTLAEIGSTIRFLLWQNDQPFMDVPPSSLKKFLTGHGNAKKEMMILHVFQQYGVTVKTNDEADAIALAMFGLCAAGVKFTTAQRETVSSILKLHLPLGPLLSELRSRCS